MGVAVIPNLTPSSLPSITVRLVRFVIAKPSRHALLNSPRLHVKSRVRDHKRKIVGWCLQNLKYLGPRVLFSLQSPHPDDLLMYRSSRLFRFQFLKRLGAVCISITSSLNHSKTTTHKRTPEPRALPAGDTAWTNSLISASGALSQSENTKLWNRTRGRPMDHQNSSLAGQDDRRSLGPASHLELSPLVLLISGKSGCPYLPVSRHRETITPSTRGFQ